jgi:hypothetical protein
MRKRSGIFLTRIEASRVYPIEDEDEHDDEDDLVALRRTANFR